MKGELGQPGLSTMSCCVAHTVGESHDQLEQATLPDCVRLSGNATLPNLQIEHTLSVLLRPGVEAEGMVLAPLLAVTGCANG